MTTFFIREKKISCNYAQKDRDPLFSSSPKNNDIKDADRSLSCKEGCPSLLGRNRSAAVCLSVYPLCHLCHRFSACRAFKRLLLEEADILLHAELCKLLGSPWPT